MLIDKKCITLTGNLFHRQKYRRATRLTFSICYWHFSRKLGSPTQRKHVFWDSAWLAFILGETRRTCSRNTCRQLLRNLHTKLQQNFAKILQNITFSLAALHAAGKADADKTEIIIFWFFVGQCLHHPLKSNTKVLSSKIIL